MEGDGGMRAVEHGEIRRLEAMRLALEWARHSGGSSPDGVVDAAVTFEAYLAGPGGGDAEIAEI